MSVMKTSPVFYCRGCGKQLIATLNTTVPDVDGKLLFMFMKNLEKIALCKPCRAKRDYYASEGREDEFEASPLEGSWRKRPSQNQILVASKYGLTQ